MKRVLMAVAMLLVTTAAFAQLGGGTVSGKVVDEQGGVLPGAAVTIVGSDRTVEATTDDAGRFRFLNLAPGSYRVSIALPGFATAVREDVVVGVGASVELPIALSVAGVSEAVTVSS